MNPLQVVNISFSQKTFKDVIYVQLRINGTSMKDITGIGATNSYVATRLATTWGFDIEKQTNMMMSLNGEKHQMDSIV